MKITSRMVCVVVISAVFLVIICASNAVAAGIKVPFFAGERWRVDQDNWDYTVGSTRNGDNITHSPAMGMSYAWDFNKGYGDDDLGYPAVAPASGIIVFAEADGDWGDTVIIHYEDDNDYRYGRIAHLDQIYVTLNQKVKQGQVIGLVGGTPNWVPHIHYQTQDGLTGNVSSIFEDMGAPTTGNEYTSENSYPIDLRHSTPHAGSIITDIIGQKDGGIHWWYTPASPITNEIIASGDAKGMSQNTYVQEYAGKPCTLNGTSQFCDGVIVYDALGGARSAYLVWYQQFGFSNFFLDGFLPPMLA